MQRQSGQSGLAISFIAFVQIIGMFSAYQLGRQTATPKAQWPKGGIMEGGWQAWRLPYFIILGLALALTVVLPILRSSGLFSGWGGMYGRGGMGGMGGMYP